MEAVTLYYQIIKERMQSNKTKIIEPESINEYKPLEVNKAYTGRIAAPEPPQYKRIESRFSQDRISSQLDRNHDQPNNTLISDHLKNKQEKGH